MEQGGKELQGLGQRGRASFQRVGQTRKGEEIMADKKRGLGRGFDSLIPTQIVEDEFDVTAKVDDSGHRTSGDLVQEVAPELVDPNPHQPRMHFEQEALEALAASIR